MTFAPRKSIWNVSLFFFLILLSGTYIFSVTADESSSDLSFFQDTDQDGLSNDEEKVYGTDPSSKDTDNDGYSDGVEVESGYNPLVPAPGDRIIPETVTTAIDTVPNNTKTDNVTMKTSQELASIVKEVTASTNPEEGVTADTINAALQNALSGTDEEIVLPEVDLKTIKIKKIPKGLKGDAKEEREKKDALEYLTVLQYLLVNNAPVPIHNQGDIFSAAQKISAQSMTAVGTGNFAYLDDLEKRGNQFLEQIKDVEVPEAMLETHVKAMQLALYAVSLKNELKTSQEDPLGQAATFGKVQAFLSEVQAFGEQVMAQVMGYGIQNIPFGL